MKPSEQPNFINCRLAVFFSASACGLPVSVGTVSVTLPSRVRSPYREPIALSRRASARQTAGALASQASVPSPGLHRGLAHAPTRYADPYSSIPVCAKPRTQTLTWGLELLIVFGSDQITNLWMYISFVFFFCKSYWFVHPRPLATPDPGH